MAPDTRVGKDKKLKWWKDEPLPHFMLSKNLIKGLHFLLTTCAYGHCHNRVRLDWTKLLSHSCPAKVKINYLLYHKVHQQENCMRNKLFD